MEIKVGSYYDPKESIEEVEDMREYETFECDEFTREVERRMKM